MNYIVFNSPIGEIKVVEDQEKIIEIKFVKDEKVINSETEILKLAKKELEEYKNNYKYVCKKKLYIPI